MSLLVALLLREKINKNQKIPPAWAILQKHIYLLIGCFWISRQRSNGFFVVIPIQIPLRRRHLSAATAPPPTTTAAATTATPSSWIHQGKELQTESRGQQLPGCNRGRSVSIQVLQWRWPKQEQEEDQIIFDCQQVWIGRYRKAVVYSGRNCSV